MTELDSAPDGELRVASPPISSLIGGEWSDVLERGSDFGLTPEEAARLSLLDAGADAYTQAVRPGNTVRSYERAWRSWEEFCAFVGLPVAPASRGMLVGYVRWRWEAGDSPATIDSRLGGIATSLRDRGHPIDRAVTAQAREVLKAEERRAAEAGQPHRGRGQAPAVTLPQLRAMSEHCPDDLGGIRDRALLLVGFGIAARRSELAGLLVGDVEVHSEGLRVTTRFGKKGGRTVTVRPGRNPLTDPVAGWLAWLEAAGHDEGPAFLRVDQWGNLGGEMSDRAVNERVAACAQRAGLSELTSHGLRAGLATTARRAGKDPEKIADQGGWARNSKALLGYIRSVDAWGDSATADIGL
ncbi:tyrosine-type recombinase/integrase [Actinomadura rudentiformis]|nr:tyrosine-type recombinase/integrase [Actinomadura rudentiformis]